jgi:mono/diheme cytochrome c family protein
MHIHISSAFSQFFIKQTIMIGIALLPLSSAVAAQPGDAAAGKKLTDFSCRNCHDVSGSEKPKNPPGGAPSFYDVAQRPETTEESLHKFLTLTHGRMVNVLLTGREVDNATAYILSMKRK